MQTEKLHKSERENSKEWTEQSLSSLLRTADDRNWWAAYGIVWVPQTTLGRDGTIVVNDILTWEVCLIHCLAIRQFHRVYIRCDRENPKENKEKTRRTPTNWWDWAKRCAAQCPEKWSNEIMGAMLLTGITDVEYQKTHPNNFPMALSRRFQSI